MREKESECIGTGGKGLVVLLVRHDTLTILASVSVFVVVDGNQVFMQGWTP